ncbi:MAG: ribosome-binding factor A [Puniceicoccales bacterium]|jgi:ribosome-binding factor A|nr:ribosome-binding factor A [Puniceicoccales bacterium]
MSLHLNRINEAIEHEINALLRTRFQEETMAITIVGALLSPGQERVQIKFSVLGDAKIRYRAIQFFSKYKNFIKQKLCEKIKMRRFPELKFEITDAIAQGHRFIDLLDTLTEN